MPSRFRFNRRLVLPVVLAAVLAGEVTGLALAARIAPNPPSAHVPAGPAGSIAFVARDLGSRDGTQATGPTEPANGTARYGNLARPVAVPHVAKVAAPRVRAAVTNHPASTTAPGYRGRNHVWIPALGINLAIAPFPCSRSRPPDNYLYRWGCAGANNVYLLGHAYSVFKPLHDAYVGGRLKTGLRVFYADGNGSVRTYAVTWWKVTPPTTSASWAWAAQSRPSMTLQTCLGAHSEYRLMVRLVAVD